jgi:hypothetical protein
MTIESITRKEACELIRKSIGGNMPEGEVFDKIVFAVNNDMQVRDFMLGLPEYYDTQEVIDFLCHMSNETSIKEDAPFVTVGAAIAYECGNMEQFYKHVGYIATHTPNYSLNQMLMRVAASGFPRDMLTKMRKELAAKVMQVCYADEAYVITAEEEPTQTQDKE